MRINERCNDCRGTGQIAMCGGGQCRCPTCNGKGTWVTDIDDHAQGE